MTDHAALLADALRRFVSPRHLLLCTTPESCKFATGARVLEAYEASLEGL